MIVDTHVHVVASDEARYPLQPSGVGSNWFRDAPMSVEDYVTLMDEAGVDRAVLVQAVGAYGYDNRYVLDAARTDPERFTAVCAVDAAGDVAAGVRDLAERDATGVRLLAIESGPRPAAWLDDEVTFTVWQAARQLGLPVVPALLPSQLLDLARALDEFPDVPVALDHCGFGSLDQLRGLARFRSLHLKVSSIVLESADEPRRFLEQLAASFGADRLLWGSDYPQTHDRPYGDLLALARDASAELGEDAQAGFLGLNALRLWPSLGSAP